MALGLHVIQYPSGRWGYVGDIPTALCTEIPASTSAILGQRWHKNADGDLMEWKTPSFTGEAEAIAFAEKHGYSVLNRQSN